MAGDGKQGVVDGLNQALDPERASQSMIQPADGDTNEVIAFSDRVLGSMTARGSDTSELLSTVEGTDSGGGTDIYLGLEEALKAAEAEQAKGDGTVAIVLMTDGRSETGNKDKFFESYRSSGLDVPVFSIMFGDADSSQLDELSDLTNGKTFDGRSDDLASVFRTVKGYN